MSLKMKLTSAIIMFMLIVATLVIGVLAAKSQTISMKGNVSFNINDRSLYLKSVRYKVGNDATEPVTLENFLPGYIDTNMEVNIGDHEFNYSAFTLYFDIVNTTANTYNAVEEVTLSQKLSSQGVTASASGKISPTQETDSDGDNYAEITPTSKPTGTITLTVTSTSTQAINLGDITITIEQYVPINYTELGYAFSGNSITSLDGNVTDLIIPSSYKIDETTGDYIEDLDGTGTPITSIADYAFQNNTTLTSITIPETVTSIGIYAFNGCSNLQTVEFGAKSQLQTIGNYAFYQCTSLTTIIIPETVISIGDYVFWLCSSLQTVDFGTSSQLQTIGNDAFFQCASLTTITIPETVKSIGYSAFQECSSLTTITIPETVTNIGSYAFRDCSSLITIKIPETIEAIGNSAFYGCSSLTTITIPEGVTSIGSDAFLYCYALAIVYNNSSLDIIAGNSDNGYVGDYAKEIITPSTPEAERGRVIIDNQVQYYANDNTGVKIALAPAVARNALTSVILATDTTEINRNAFFDCTSLQTVNFGKNSQLRTVGRQAFQNCRSLTTITIPKAVTSIEQYAFQNCYALVIVYNNSSIRITAGSSVNHYAGYYAKEVVTAKNPQKGRIVTENQVQYYVNGNTKIALLPSVEIENLTSVILATDTTEINQYAFYQCTSLTSITISETVTSIIGSYAFYGCSSLTSITIPETVIGIGTYTFSTCINLKTVVINSQYAYRNATNTGLCGSLLANAQTVKVLSSVVETGTNSYLTNTSNFPYTWTEGEYTVFSKTA